MIYSLSTIGRRFIASHPISSRSPYLAKSPYLGISGSYMIWGTGHEEVHQDLRWLDLLDLLDMLYMTYSDIWVSWVLDPRAP